MRNFCLLILMLSSVLNADVIEVDRFYLEAEKTVATNRHLYLPNDSTPKNNFNLGFDLIDRSNTLYLNTLVGSIVDQSQFRYVSMDNELGINTMINAQIYFRHHSGHLLDATDYLGRRFPEENVIGIRFYLIGNYR